MYFCFCFSFAGHSKVSVPLALSSMKQGRPLRFQVFQKKTKIAQKHPLTQDAVPCNRFFSPIFALPNLFKILKINKDDQHSQSYQEKLEIVAHFLPLKIKLIDR
jgi:hypothetical protein